jgi:uncharacterized membrane protein YfcA
MDPTITGLWLAAGGGLGVGLLGAILGIGGGTLLVPYLVLVADLSPVQAVGISLFCVIGTSVGGASRALRTGQANLRLALLLEPFMLAGSVLTSFFAHRVSSPTLMISFALLLFGLGGLFLFLSIRSGAIGEVTPSGPPHFADGQCEEPGVGVVPYRPVRLPLCALLVATTGAASGLFGIGGGVLNVPYLTLVAKVPLRAAAATSVLTMLVTGAAAGAVHLSAGEIPGPWLAATVLTVVPGSALGARLQRRLPTKSLRFLFAGLALVLGVLMFHRGLGATP